MATVTWTGLGMTTYFSDPKNWDAGYVPGKNDDAVVPQGALITFDPTKQNFTLLSLTVGEGGPATVTIFGPASINVTNLTLTWSYAITYVDLIASGNTTIDTTSAGQVRNLIGGSLTITNSGLAKWAGPAQYSVYCLEGFALINSGTFDLQSDAAIGIDYLDSNPPTFTNTGLVTKTATSGGAANVLMVFMNNGTVNFPVGNILFRTPLVTGTSPLTKAPIQPVSGGTGSYIAAGQGSWMSFNRDHSFLGGSLIQADSVSFNDNTGAAGSGNIVVSGAFKVSKSTSVAAGLVVFNGTVQSIGTLGIDNGAQGQFLTTSVTTPQIQISAALQVGAGGGGVSIGLQPNLRLQPFEFPDNLAVYVSYDPVTNFPRIEFAS